MSRVTMVLMTAALALAACGKVGTLDQPAPLFGEKAKAEYRARQAAAAAAAKAPRQDDEPEALPLASPENTTIDGMPAPPPDPRHR